MVTFETAVKLKEAGFPQPSFAPLQWWYSPAEQLLLACSFEKKPAAQSPYRFIDQTRPDSPDFWASIKSFCYAPTAPDILKDAKGLYLSPMMHDDWGVFVAGSREMVGYHHENPAEACAEAWLKINKK